MSPSFLVNRWGVVLITWSRGSPFPCDSPLTCPSPFDPLFDDGLFFFCFGWLRIADPFCWCYGCVWCLVVRPAVNIRSIYIYVYISIYLTLTTYHGLVSRLKNFSSSRVESIPPSSRNRIPGSLDAICSGSIYEAERCAACGGAIRLHAGAVSTTEKTTRLLLIGSTW